MIRILRVLMVLFVGILASCSSDHYPTIEPEKSLVISVNLKDTTVTFIDMETYEKVAEWQMEKPYTGGMMLPDGDTMLLYGKQLEAIDLYSLKSGKQISSWETGRGIVNGKLLKGNKQIAFADQSLHAVRFYTLEGKEVEVVKTEHNPLTLLENERDGNLFIISYSAEILTIVNPESKEKVLDFPIHPSAAGAVIKESQNEIWIGGHGKGSEVESNIHVYDTKTGDLLKLVQAPQMPVNFLEEKGFIFVLSHGSSTLYKLDGEGNILESAKIGANPFEMADYGDSIIIAGYDSDDIHIINADSLDIMKTIEVGKGPFQLILRGD